MQSKSKCALLLFILFFSVQHLQAIDFIKTLYVIPHLLSSGLFAVWLRIKPVSKADLKKKEEGYYCQSDMRHQEIRATLFSVHQQLQDQLCVQIKLHEQKSVAVIQDFAESTKQLIEEIKTEMVAQEKFIEYIQVKSSGITSNLQQNHSQLLHMEKVTQQEMEKTRSEFGRYGQETHKKLEQLKVALGITYSIHVSEHDWRFNHLVVDPTTKLFNRFTHGQTDGMQNVTVK